MLPRELNDACKRMYTLRASCVSVKNNIMYDVTWTVCMYTNLVSEFHLRELMYKYVFIHTYIHIYICTKRLQYRKAPVVVRPPTPELRVPVAENDEKRLAVIFLQRLLRGRAIQNDMFQAKVCEFYVAYTYAYTGKRCARFMCTCLAALYRVVALQVRLAHVCMVAWTYVYARGTASHLK
jgi:hypothetical protein